MKDRRPRPIKKANRMRDIEFRETLGEAMPLPRATESENMSATYVAITLALGAAIIALLALIIVNLLNFRPISPETSGIPGGAVLPLNTTLDTSRTAQARTIAAPADAPASGQQTGVPAVPSQSAGYGDTYALQGAAGIPAAR